MNIKEHLLVCLMEEAAEVAKDASKSLRFGLEDRNVLDPTGPTNRERLIVELNDFMAIITMLGDHDIIPLDWQDHRQRFKKQQKVDKFMQYATDVGALQDEAPKP